MSYLSFLQGVHIFQCLNAFAHQFWHNSQALSCWLSRQVRYAWQMFACIATSRLASYKPLTILQPHDSSFSISSWTMSQSVNRSLPWQTHSSKRWGWGSETSANRLASKLRKHARMHQAIGSSAGALTLPIHWYAAHLHRYLRTTIYASGAWCCEEATDSGEIPGRCWKKGPAVDSESICTFLLEMTLATIKLPLGNVRMHCCTRIPTTDPMRPGSEKVGGGRKRLCSPEGPKRTLEAKKGQLVISEATIVYSAVLGTPFRPRRQESANSAPAYAMDRVAEPCAVMKFVSTDQSDPSFQLTGHAVCYCSSIWNWKLMDCSTSMWLEFLSSDKCEDGSGRLLSQAFSAARAKGCRGLRNQSASVTQLTGKRQPISCAGSQSPAESSCQAPKASQSELASMPYTKSPSSWRLPC